ncbi:hypothetical protein C0Q88_07845 [Ralstonia pickettii]|uniref:Uncharacterized protein n=1 Tax=Ralstonia pickettii TaxID=329 RepID=A0A2N4TY42_RALPI|nr:hypothetical protein [Ralstonia pickettii]PLC44583.1 hypothetical protein C0Q88_07845 [Ralstonia pickettii]
MRLAVENDLSAAMVSVYDPTKITASNLFHKNTGSNPQDNYVGPTPIALARPMEQSASIPGMYPHAIQVSSTMDWVFLADGAAAAATRRFILYEFNRSTGQFNWKGYITATFPSATAHTVRGFRALRDVHTTGTVAVSGTGVTGAGTGFSTERIAAGSRIGFGSTDPNAITTWYEISSIASDTSLTLTGSAGTIAAGTPYVVEELRLAIVTTNATAANGGLFVVKGLRPELFVSGGTTIPAATTTDNVRAVFWLADAATVTNTSGAGCAIKSRDDFATHYCYALDTAGKIYKYNMRAALALTGGKATLSGADVVVTGVQAVSGTMKQVNNGRIATLNHGPGAGVLCLYFATSTRIYRVVESSITAGNTTWQADFMVETPPGSSNTLPASSSMDSVEVASTLDRLVILTSSGYRKYLTQYRTDASPVDIVWGSNTQYYDQTTNDSGTPVSMADQGLPWSCWVENGMCYLARTSTFIANNSLYAFPMGADWNFAASTGQRLITPAISTPNALKYSRLYVNEVAMLGSNALGISTEPYRVYARTAGISDNSGAWTLLDSSLNLGGMAGAAQIQFAFEFRTVGFTCAPARICGLCVTYDSGDYLPTGMEWSLNDSDTTNNIIGFAQTTVLGGVPNLQIDFFREDTDANVLTQQSTGNANGAFEYWDGAGWSAGVGPDAVGTRRRFRPTAGLPANVNLYVKLKAI